MAPTNNTPTDSKAAKPTNRLAGLASGGLFDSLDNLKLQQDFGAATGVKKVITAIRGGPYTEAEQLALLDYCQTDVDELAELLTAMLTRIDLPRALLRGRYMQAVARM